MSEYVMTMTQRSQVTVPAEVRRVLGLKPRDQVAFEIDGEEVRLKPVKWTLESVAGSVEPLSDGPQDFDEQIRQAKEEHAERYVRKMMGR
jgi:AbrB family looped-hinge helix DNA binding protein